MVKAQVACISGLAGKLSEKLVTAVDARLHIQVEICLH